MKCVYVRWYRSDIGNEGPELAAAEAHSIYVLAKGGLAAIRQVSVDDEMPQSAPNNDDGQVQ